MSIHELFDKLEDTCGPLVNVEFEWTANSVGFGRFYFYYNQTDEKLHISNEMMGKDFIKKMLCKMVDDAVLDE